MVRAAVWPHPLDEGVVELLTAVGVPLPPKLPERMQLVMRQA